MNRKLIRANLALAKGERAEAERLLRQMRGDGIASDPEQRALMLWLEAQAQHDRAARIRKLYDLINIVPAENPYSQLARDYLQEEEAYALPDETVSTVWWLRILSWKVALFSLFTVFAVALVFFVLSPRSPIDELVQATQSPPPATAAAILPDRSRPLVADGFTARYERGILQIAAVEDDSARVMAVDGETRITPVEGARFFALNVYFECRQGICNAPPEASIALRLDDGTLIAAKENAIIAGEPIFAPIALGRTTRGWLIFEIPVINGVSALVVIPHTADRTTPEPLLIPLGAH
jgi:hypothetical protein